MRKLRLVLALSGAACLVAVSLQAQPGGPHGTRRPGWTQAPPGYATHYDPASEETVKGQVIKIERSAPFGGQWPGVHLLLETDEGNVRVRLGPAWYVDNQPVQISTGDTISVNGARINVDGEQTIIAREVHVGSRVMHLRDARGKPYWAVKRKGSFGRPQSQQGAHGPLSKPQSNQNGQGHQNSH